MKVPAIKNTEDLQEACQEDDFLPLVGVMKRCGPRLRKEVVDNHETLQENKFIKVFVKVLLKDASVQIGRKTPVVLL